MRKWITIGLLLGLFSQAGWAFPGAAERQSEKQQKSEVEKIVRNKSLLNDLMERIVADAALRQQMLQKLAAFAKTNPQAMNELKSMLASGQAIATKGEDMAEILVKFKSDVAATQVQALASEFKLQEVRAIPQLNIRVYKIPPGKKMDDILARIKKKSYIEYAEPNRTYHVQE